MTLLEQTFSVCGCAALAATGSFPPIQLPSHNFADHSLTNKKTVRNFISHLGIKDKMPCHQQ
jgi:hypothetical protein